MKKRTIWIIAVLGLLLCLAGKYLYYQNTALQTTHYQIKSEKIPADFDGYKIAQISDSHNTRSEKLTSSLLDALKDQEPDLIALTGDLVDSQRTDIDIAISFIQRLQEIAPVYFM